MPCPPQATAPASALWVTRGTAKNGWLESRRAWNLEARPCPAVPRDVGPRDVVKSGHTQETSALGFAEIFELHVAVSWMQWPRQWVWPLAFSGKRDGKTRQLSEKGVVGSGPCDHSAVHSLWEKRLGHLAGAGGTEAGGGQGTQGAVAVSGPRGVSEVTPLTASKLELQLYVHVLTDKTPG